jgi:tRNA-2-methylthio-N6-dimethylallyladenosine synthase
MNKGKKRYFIETFGCQMNVNDSEKVAGLLQASGYESARSAASADFVFVNTCAVREKATEKLYSSLGRLKRLKDRNPDVAIGVGGCVSQLHGSAILERAPYVDLIVGPQSVARVPDLLERRGAAGPLIDLDKNADSFAVGPDSVAHSNPFRAYVTVMEGCNHVCSFCVVPRTRGLEVCREPGSILGEVSSLVARGVPEVMLLGQTVNAYRYGSVGFAELLSLVDGVPGLERLRFTTSHPSHMSAEVASALGRLEKLCPYVHLPVQSGSDRILESMRRGYTRAQYLEIVRRLRAAIPGLALSSDVIVGYPGEGADDFQRTFDLVQEVGLDGLFVFTYSPRPGTSAVRLPDDVPAGEKKRRLHVLNDYQQALQARRHRERVGARVEVLVEGRSGTGRLFGRTPQFLTVHFDAADSLLGRRIEVEIVDAGPNALMGQLVPAGDRAALPA